MITTIIIFFVILATLVLVHELGHFIVARRNGVASEEFGFGFPPRLVGTYKDKEGKRRWVFGNKEIEEEIKNKEETVYSINLIPLGGFVRIKGEDGGHKNEKDSFSSKSVWPRFKIISAGVAMNFVLAVVLFTAAFTMGLPESIEDDQNPAGAKVQIAQVSPDSPAREAGLQIGDEVARFSAGNTPVVVNSIEQLQNLIRENAGKKVFFEVIHPGEDDVSQITVNIRSEAPEGQGLTGIVLVKTAFVRHSFFESLWLAVQTTFSMILAIFLFLGDLLFRLFTSRPISADVAGPVGIAVMTGQVAKLGLAYIFQFAALLSVNLAVINFFPFPALDGGRAVFLLVEKIKGSPVSQKVEGVVHTVGFIFLLGLMLLVTVRDFMNFDIVEKIKGIF